MLLGIHYGHVEDVRKLYQR